MERIQDFQGLQYPFSTDPVPRKAYDANNIEYATSSHQIDHDMFPGLIACPQGDDDIQKAIKYARDDGYPIAVMSGGHQYSGACSTDVYASVSHSLGEFNKFLRDNKLFVPHGQCADVRLGGHAQTGGYGQLGRSFGLLGDHILGFRMINYDGEIQEVTRASNQELFYAVLGGSPGNFGVITHYTIAAHQDRNHDFPPNGPRPHGFKGVWLYNEKVLKLLLNEVAAMADDPDFPRNFDLCVTVLSSSFSVLKLVPEMEENWPTILRNIADLLGVDGDTEWPASIFLYAQWVPMSADDIYTDKVDAWFQKFRKLDCLLEYWCIHAATIIEPMSQMTGEWIFELPREFNYPYEKRTYMTNSRTLARDKWVDQVAKQIHLVMVPSFTHLPLWENCYLSVQIQCFGGNYSQYYVNRDNGTSYSWRDSTVCQVLDCFYKDTKEGKQLAVGWQTANDKLMVGPNSAYSKQDKRVLWASYGDWNLENTWPFYYEDKAKYERIGRQRHLADPNGTFTPNPFNVRAVA